MIYFASIDYITRVVGYAHKRLRDVPGSGMELIGIVCTAGVDKIEVYYDLYWRRGPFNPEKVALIAKFRDTSMKEMFAMEGRRFDIPQSVMNEIDTMIAHRIDSQISNHIYS